MKQVYTKYLEDLENTAKEDKRLLRNVYKEMSVMDNKDNKGTKYKFFFFTVILIIIATVLSIVFFVFPISDYSIWIQSFFLTVSFLILCLTLYKLY